MPAVPDLQRRGLIADLTRRLALAGWDELRVLDRALLMLEQARQWRWERRLATSATDYDPMFHIVACWRDGAVVTRCNGRWPLGDAVETQSDGPLLAERCRACWRAQDETDVSLAVAALASYLAAEDRGRERLRDAAGAELAEIERHEPTPT